PGTPPMRSESPEARPHSQGTSAAPAAPNSEGPPGCCRRSERGNGRGSPCSAPTRRRCRTCRSHSGRAPGGFPSPFRKVDAAHRPRGRVPAGGRLAQPAPEGLPVKAPPQEVPEACAATLRLVEHLVLRKSSFHASL